MLQTERVPRARLTEWGTAWFLNWRKRTGCSVHVWLHNWSETLTSTKHSVRGWITVVLVARKKVALIQIVNGQLKQTVVYSCNCISIITHKYRCHALYRYQESNSVRRYWHNTLRNKKISPLIMNSTLQYPVTCNLAPCAAYKNLRSPAAGGRNLMFNFWANGTFMIIRQLAESSRPLVWWSFILRTN